MATEIWANFGAGNGLLREGTKPLPEPILTYQKGPAAFLWGQFDIGYISQQSLKLTGKLLYKSFIQISQGQMS